MAKSKAATKGKKKGSKAAVLYLNHLEEDDEIPGRVLSSLNDHCTLVTIKLDGKDHPCIIAPDSKIHTDASGNSIKVKTPSGIVSLMGSDVKSAVYQYPEEVPF